MKCPKLADYTKNASTVDPNQRAMYGTYRGDTEQMGIATYWPRAACKDYESRKIQLTVTNAGKKT